MLLPWFWGYPDHRAQPVVMDSVKNGVVNCSTQFGDLTWSFVYLLCWCLRSEQQLSPKTGEEQHAVCLLAL